MSARGSAEKYNSAPHLFSLLHLEAIVIKSIVHRRIRIAPSYIVTFTDPEDPLSKKRLAFANARLMDNTAPVNSTMSASVRQLRDS